MGSECVLLKECAFQIVQNYGLRGPPLSRPDREHHGARPGGEVLPYPRPVAAYHTLYLVVKAYFNKVM
jgi:hypothetical protein